MCLSIYFIFFHGEKDKIRYFTEKKSQICSCKVEAAKPTAKEAAI